MDASGKESTPFPLQTRTQAPSAQSVTESGQQRLPPSNSLRPAPGRRALVAAFALGVAASVAAAGITFAVRSLPSSEHRHAVRWAERRIRALKPFLRQHAVAAELGVLQGDFTRELVDELKPARLLLVDPWYLQGLEWSWKDRERSTIDALSGLLHDFAPELARGQVVLNVAFDQDLLATLPDAYLDWAYLDTTHEYAQTKLELRLLQKKVKPSGVIAGDDWQPDPAHRHHGVYKAVQELLAEGHYKLLYADTECWQWVIGRADRPSKSR